MLLTNKLFVFLNFLNYFIIFIDDYDELCEQYVSLRILNKKWFLIFKLPKNCFSFIRFSFYVINICDEEIFLYF